LTRINLAVVTDRYNDLGFVRERSEHDDEQAQQSVVADDTEAAARHEGPLWGLLKPIRAN
jgi:hypothetical protein